MRKRTTTRWYMGAWLVWLVAFVALAGAIHAGQGTSTMPSFALVVYAVMVGAGIVMLVTWLGALIRLGQQRAWAWFAAVLVLHLVGLGIIGMAAYAVAGPEDPSEVVIRPRRVA